MTLQFAEVVLVAVRRELPPPLPPLPPPEHGVSSSGLIPVLAVPVVEHVAGAALVGENIPAAASGAALQGENRHSPVQAAMAGAIEQRSASTAGPGGREN